MPSRSSQPGKIDQPTGRPAGRAKRLAARLPVAPADLKQWVGRRLRAWFGRHQRELPWRRDRDPYRIWVSEVMLQQTQAATVVPYFERFLQAFPTLEALAAADEHDVLRLWEGLGYYRRARDLHRAAARLAADYGGRFPEDPAVVRGLPGLGPYTTNAILSQAFDRRLPILEANSQRVLSRFFGRAEDPRQGPARAWLWRAAEELLPGRPGAPRAAGVGDFNQALMELGALVCTPAAPRCGDCPLAARCVARQQGLQEVIPARAPPPAPTDVREAAVVVRRGQQVLLVQRPPHGRWGSLWEFPHGALQEGETYDDGARRLAAELTGLQTRLGPELLTVRHGITRYRVTLVCFEADFVAGSFHSPSYARGQWLAPAALADYPVSSPQRQLARALARQGRQRRLF
jgi:A/G-specific adenine glycosylase